MKPIDIGILSGIKELSISWKYIYLVSFIKIVFMKLWSLESRPLVWKLNAEVRLKESILSISYVNSITKAKLLNNFWE
jgi:hypothetical protein